MKTQRNIKAFTLVELLTALLVTSILLSAMATLAYAMSSATRTSDDTAIKQAQLRHTTLRLGELIRTSRMICAAPGNDLAVWTSDNNDDGLVNVDELVYIERGGALDSVSLCQFPAGATALVDFGSLTLTATKTQLLADYEETILPLLPTCRNVQFIIDVNPPDTRRVTISFDLTENQADHRYEVTATLRAWAGNLLNDSGDALIGDDD
jgi:prepilin-type N-terminal cleavage/methylation domain-containing protein